MHYARIQRRTLEILEQGRANDRASRICDLLIAARGCNTFGKADFIRLPCPAAKMTIFMGLIIGLRSKLVMQMDVL